MRKKVIILASLLLLIVAFFIVNNNSDLFDPKPYDKIVSIGYKETSKGDSLKIKIYYPKSTKKGLGISVVMFHGGGWKTGHMGQFYEHAKVMAANNITSILVQYRTQETHGTTPFDALKDARSAMRFIKQNATELKVDTTKLVAMGSSAGGHLALGTAMLNSYNDPKDNLNIDPSPTHLILLSSIIDCGPTGYGNKQVKEAYLKFSPMHTIAKDLPPLLMLFGDQDRHTSPQKAQEFAARWRKNGNSCELKIYPGQEHGFTGYVRSRENFNEMITTVLDFLKIED